MVCHASGAYAGKHHFRKEEFFLPPINIHPSAAQDPMTLLAEASSSRMQEEQQRYRLETIPIADVQWVKKGTEAWVGGLRGGDIIVSVSVGDDEHTSQYIQSQASGKRTIQQAIGRAFLDGVPVKFRTQRNPNTWVHVDTDTLTSIYDIGCKFLFR